MDLKDIKGIVDLMKKNAVSEFEMEEGDFKIKLKRDSGKSRAVQELPPVILPAPATAIPTSPSPAPVVATAPEPVKEDGPEVKSPMIGTFYRKPSPDADSFVEVGSSVDADTVVCIIEAMKVMNEIKAEVKGTIVEVLVEDGKPVEYGQALFRVKAD